MIDLHTLDQLIDEMKASYVPTPVFYISEKRYRQLKLLFYVGRCYFTPQRKLRKCHMRKMCRRRKQARRRYDVWLRARKRMGNGEEAY